MGSGLGWLGLWASASAAAAAEILVSQSHPKSHDGPIDWVGPFSFVQSGVKEKKARSVAGLVVTGMEIKTLAETVKANNPKLAIPNFFIPNFSRSAFLENTFDFLGQQGVHVIAEAILTALLDLIPIILDLFDGIGQDDE